MKTEQLSVTTAGGIGRPDYSQEVAMGQVRPGLSLKYGQTLIIGAITFAAIPYYPSLFPWVQPVLAPAGTAHIIDVSTGLPFPYTTAIGYVYKIIQVSSNFTEDCRSLAYMDGIFLGSAGVSPSGQPTYAADIIGIDTSLLDPIGASAHQYDVVFENIGGDDLQGAAGIFGIYEAVGTPPLPTTKKIKCRVCGYETTVSVHVTRLDCPTCGNTTMYIDTSLIRKT